MLDSRFRGNDTHTQRPLTVIPAKRSASRNPGPLPATRWPSFKDSSGSPLPAFSMGSTQVFAPLGSYLKIRLLALNSPTP
jgi:hypothetical protein